VAFIDPLLKKYVNFLKNIINYCQFRSNPIGRRI